MLTFEEKLKIIESFPALTRHHVSLGRVNFHYEGSVMDKQIVVYRLHPNGNGFVYAGMISEEYPMDAKGMVNIRNFSEQELRHIIQQSIDSLSEAEPFTETWVNREEQTLSLVHDFDLWNVYAGDMLDGTFETYRSAADYLQQEGFVRLADKEKE
ncbi:hypothetical protein [Virgibacillus salexigens]|uniref:Uncharacterized protein n=2 Tax=Virgibacillus TaxID=84406 RepID=A0A024QDF5_9BACI|nr:MULTISPECIES: hypothetical protein [Virgibacillus]MYL42681.1 hypothetical protein [Virgibacillus massiliensis]GGJ75994.1 hypothetical protein GCM10007111_41930 [Virgibacillus kapii]CDQ40568.1 hypothetical protein BN990_02893 [Virgibacillus massiliensis]